MSSRPFDAVLKLLSTPSSVHPPPTARARIARAYRRHGASFFFGPQGADKLLVGRAGALKRAGWKVAGVMPWGLGFVAYAWIGGEV